MNLSNIGSSGDASGGLPATIAELPRNEGQAFYSLVMPYLMVAKQHGVTDEVRRGVRLTLGWSELPTHLHRHHAGGRPVDDRTGAFVPRINAAHQSSYTEKLLEALLPILSEGLSLTQHTFRHKYPHQQDPVSALCELTEGLPFPYQLKLEHGAQLVPSKSAHDMALRCMSRMSISFVAGEEARDRVLDLVTSTFTHVDRSKLGVKINEIGQSILHVDERDVGEGGKLKDEAKYTGNGIQPVGCGERILQFVYVISCNVDEDDALAAVGVGNADHSFTLVSTPLEESERGAIRLTVFAMDFSATWHGNVRQGTERDMAPNAWAMRITTYVTTHAATWASHIRSLPSDEAAEMLMRWSGMKTPLNPY